jgi:teichuronic acid biosynthesis glycosyltransferase TuaH
MTGSEAGILHVIVGDSDLTPGAIAYRRHRLADYLTRQATTSAVYWVWPAGPQYHNDTGAVENRRSDDVCQTPPPVRTFAVPAARRFSLYSELLQKGVFVDLVRTVQTNPAHARVLWYTVPAYSRLLRELHWDVTVYDCSDHWTGRVRGKSVFARVFSQLHAHSERRIVTGSRLLFASSVFLQERLETEFGRDSTLVEHGVDFSAFHDAPSATDPEIEFPARPRLAFIGSLKQHKIDFELLAAVASVQPNWNFVLVGPQTDACASLQALLRLPNVSWLGQRRPQEIPSIMKQMDLGLLPYRSSEYNAGVFPLKLIEYLAAGLPVVGCGLPSTLKYVADGTYIHTPSKPEAFAAGCIRAMQWQSTARTRVEVARASDWQDRLGGMHQAVLDRLGSRMRFPAADGTGV